MSFGSLQRAFSANCVKLMIEGNEAQAKEDLREYIDYLRSKEPLLRQFHVYENILRHEEPDRELAIMFIRESLAQLEDLTRGDILTHNTLLRHRFNLQAEATELDKALDLLVEAKVSDFNYDTSRTSKAFKVVLEHVMAPKPEQQPLQEMLTKRNQFGDANLEFFTPQDVVRIGVKKFNKEFGPLFTEAERTMFRKLQEAEANNTLTELYESEYADMEKRVDAFVNEDLDEDLIRNIVLAKKKLKDQVSVDNLLNIFELKTQIEELQNEAR